MTPDVAPQPDPNPLSAHNPDVVVDCHIRELYYGSFKAVLNRCPG